MPLVAILLPVTLPALQLLFPLVLPGWHVNYAQLAFLLKSWQHVHDAACCMCGMTPGLCRQSTLVMLGK
jgi:hypothetical protein